MAVPTQQDVDTIYDTYYDKARAFDEAYFQHVADVVHENGNKDFAGEVIKALAMSRIDKSVWDDFVEAKKELEKLTTQTNVAVWRREDELSWLYPKKKDQDEDTDQ